MPTMISEIVHEYAKDMRRLFGEDLGRIVMYGSYARGDFRENSDIDLMILVGTPEERISVFADRVSDRSFDYLMEYGINISAVIKNEKHFDYWADDLPYYRNVRDEGIIIHAE